MTPASSASVSHRDAHAASITVKGQHAEVSSPLDGVLRLLFKRESPAHENFALAVQPLPAPRELKTEGAAITADGIGLKALADGTLELRARTKSGEMQRIFAIHEVLHTPTGVFEAVLEVGVDDPFFGLGEHPGPMNRRHRRVLNWNLDHAPHTPSTPSFYCSFPIYFSHTRDARDCSVWYAVFLDNPGRSSFQLAVDAADRATLAVGTGHLDLYVISGPTPEAVLRRYCGLTGTMEMPPKWMFGYQQSRWSYTPAVRVREVASAFREHQFPCDVLYLDIHYMNCYRAFTWDPETFPDPPGLIDDLHGQGFKAIPILNSAVAVDPEFPTYREGHASKYFLRHADGREYHDKMWPGLSAFPDFSRADVREWWGGLHADILDLDVDGIWNDMNEPTVFGDKPAQTFPMDLVHEGGGTPRTHDEMHNLYGLLMDVATHEGLRRLRPGKRVPLLTRSAYAGVQRYAFLWTGDNSAWWEHMRMCISQVCNLGLSGVPVSGPDVGGFHDDCSGEMFLRWIQMGIFFPYLRAHSAQGTRDAEPWCFGPEILELTRRFVHLRYRLLPYIYTLSAASSRRGDLIMRPLFYEFPDDPSAEVADDQFMLGPHLMVAPILAPGAFYRAVYLPEGEWFSYFGDTIHEGANVIAAETPLAHIPVYVRANAIIPMGAPMQYVGQAGVDPTIEWHVWASSRGEGQGWLYEDDGISDGDARASKGFCETHVRGAFREERVTLHFAARSGDYDPGARDVEIVLHGHRRAPRSCSHGTLTSRDDLMRIRFPDDGQAHEVQINW